MAAIAMCIAVMFCATALIAGFKNEISDKIFGFWGHVHITDASINRSLLEPRPIKANTAFLDSLRTVEQIEYQLPLNILGFEFEDTWVSKESNGGIKHIQSFGIKPGIIKTKTDLEGVILKGVSTDYNWEFIGNYLVEGEAIAFNDTIASRDIIISQQTSNRLNSKVGDKILVHFIQDDRERKKAFRIKGIYKTGLEEYDKKFALVDLKIVQELLGWAEDEVAGFEVLLDDIDDLEVMKDYIYLEELPQGYYAQTIKDKFPVNFQWLEMQSTNEQVIVGLMLAVGIINMITALLILILERTTMIGILKALGSTDWMLQKMFLEAYFGAI